MTRIFISYRRDDEVFARRLATSLSDAGADVWIDVDDIPAGMKWSTAIQQGLKLCDVLIVLITPESMASGNVEDEWQYFLDEGKPVIPVLLREAEVHFQLRRIQYVDFESQPYDVAFAQLHGELRRRGAALDPLTPDDAGVAQAGAQSKRGWRRAGWLTVAVALLLIGVLAIGYLVWPDDDDTGAKVTPSVEVDANATNTATPTVTPTPWPTMPPMPTPIPQDIESPITLVDSFLAPGRSAEGITWDGTNLWVSTGESRIFKLDTAGKTLGSYSAPDPAPGGMAWDGEYLWVYTGNMNQVYQFEIDGVETQPVDSFGVPTQVSGGAITNDLAWDAGQHVLWYANQYNLFQMTTSGEINKTVAHPQNITGLEWDGRYLWAVHNESFNAVLDVLDTNGDVLSSFNLPVYAVYGLAFGEDSTLWVTGQRSFTESEHYVFELDASAVQAMIETENPESWQAEVFTLYETALLLRDSVASLTPQPPAQAQDGMRYLVGDVGLITGDYDAVLSPKEITLVDADGQVYAPVGLETIASGYLVGDLSGTFVLHTREPPRVELSYEVFVANDYGTQTFRSNGYLLTGDDHWPDVRLVWEVPDDVDVVSLALPGMSVTELPEIYPLYP